MSGSHMQQLWIVIKRLGSSLIQLLYVYLDYEHR